MSDRRHYSGRFVLRLPRFLHLELSKAAQREDISLNQYCIYLLSRRFSTYSLSSMLEKIHQRTANIPSAKIEKTIQEVIREVRKEEKKSKK